MASINTSDGWNTNFIYEQDLRSVYMNSLLYSLFRPGIHNANIKLINGTSTGGTTRYDTLIARIEKGTTFVFSNDYLNNPYGSRDLYRRNFTGDETGTKNESLIGSKIPVIIKCTAIKDIDMEVTCLKNNDDYATKPWDLNSDIYTETIPPEELFLCAYMMYDENGEADNFGYTPLLCLTRNNPLYGNAKAKESDETEEEGPENDRFFYFHTKPGLTEYTSSSSGLYRLPDGSSHYGLAQQDGITRMSMYNYLMIGAVLDNKVWTGESNKYTSFNSNWMRNHTFTGRGLPEYRYPMINESNGESPDFVIPMDYNSDDSIKFNRLYIDFNNIINYDNVYDTSIDWEKAYKIARQKPGVTSTGYFTYSKLDGTEGSDYISYSLTDDEINTLKNRTVSKAVLDFTFVTSRSYLNIDTDDLKDILKSGQSESKLKLYNHREIVDAGSNINDYSIIDKLRFDYDGDLYSDTSGGKDGYYLSLDISSNNVDRLLQFIKNTNIMSRVINKIRRDGDLDPANGEALIPVAISFRLFPYVYEYVLTQDETILSGKTYYKYNIESKTYEVYTPSVSPIEEGAYERVCTYELSSDTTFQTGKVYYIYNSEKGTYSRATVTAGDPLPSPNYTYYELVNDVRTDTYDYITSYDQVNPINVLSLLDINYKMTKLNPIVERPQDAYSIITVIQ